MSIEAPIQGNNARLGGEVTLNTPVAGANDTVLNTTNRYYTFFTLPGTSSDLYLVTGFEVLNGTVVAGSHQCFLEKVDQNLPSSSNTTTVAWSRLITMAGASAVQRIPHETSHLIPGGTLVGASVVTSSATARYGTTTVAAGNRLRAIAVASPNNTHQTAWGSGTEEPYIKVYAKRVF